MSIKRVFGGFTRDFGKEGEGRKAQKGMYNVVREIILNTLHERQIEVLTCVVKYSFHCSHTFSPPDILMIEVF